MWEIEADVIKGLCGNIATNYSKSFPPTHKNQILLLTKEKVLFFFLAKCEGSPILIVLFFEINSGRKLAMISQNFEQKDADLLLQKKLWDDSYCDPYKWQEKIMRSKAPFDGCKKCGKG